LRAKSGHAVGWRGWSREGLLPIACANILRAALRGCAMKRIGIIAAGSAYPMEGFRLGLRELGAVEGKNISFEVRAAGGKCAYCLNLPPKWSFSVLTSLPSLERLRCERFAKPLRPFPSCLRWLLSRSATDWQRIWRVPVETSRG